MRATGGERECAERQRGLGAEGVDGQGQPLSLRPWKETLRGAPLRPSGTLGYPPPFLSHEEKPKRGLGAALWRKGRRPLPSDGHHGKAPFCHHRRALRELAAV